MSNEDWLCSLLNQESGEGASKAMTKSQNVPVYEKNETTHSVLTALRGINERANICAENYIDLYKLITSEYTGQINVLTEIFNNMGISKSVLPDLVAEIASKSSSDITLGKKTGIDHGASDIEPEVTHQATALQTLQNIQKLSQSMEDTNAAEQKDIQRKQKEVEFLTKKGQELATATRHYDKRLGTFSPEGLSHASIMERVNQVNALQAKLREIRRNLSSYGDLTPDINITRLQVEKAKADLAKLEEEISNKLSSLHTQ